ncbi:MAG TPA: hemerythrin domain-containing protein [Usitatibacter sp.]|jgi:hemerythrin-like domain-containing protein|nr:hemerythrin domain-containing protein [Usitatibacter sp.]
MKGNARPSLFDTTAAFDDPLEMLLACHRRIEKQLQTLERLRGHLQSKGVDAEASSAAQGLLRYFMHAAVDHHADEENDLFPLLEVRISDAGDGERFRQVRQSLEREHREVEAQWARLRKPLEAIADGFSRTLGEADVRAFAEAYERHIQVEEAALHEFFERFIGPEDRAALGSSMSARRSRKMGSDPFFRNKGV